MKKFHRKNNGNDVYIVELIRNIDFFKNEKIFPEKMN